MKVNFVDVAVAAATVEVAITTIGTGEAPIAKNTQVPVEDVALGGGEEEGGVATAGTTTRQKGFDTNNEKVPRMITSAVSLLCTSK